MVSHDVFLEAQGRAEALARRTSLGVGGTPDYLFEPRTVEQASAIVRACRQRGLPLRYLGGGYNLLVGDDAIEGAVVSTKGLVWLSVYDETVEVGAGSSFPALVRKAIELGIPALPGCPGIPGSVGGVVFMNAGGRFGSVSDALEAVSYLDSEGEPRRRAVEEGDLSYRASAFGGCLITGAAFRRDATLSEASQRALYDEAMAWKRATQPLSAKSAGCIFKNPDGATGERSAGRLIEEAGLKGRRVGGAMVSPLHANFIENVDGATAEDVRRLIRLIQSEVRSRFDVVLELEVHTWA